MRYWSTGADGDDGEVGGGAEQGRFLLHVADQIDQLCPLGGIGHTRFNVGGELSRPLHRVETLLAEHLRDQ